MDLKNQLILRIGIRPENSSQFEEVVKMGIDPENSSQFEELIEVVKIGIDPEYSSQFEDWNSSSIFKSV